MNNPGHIFESLEEIFGLKYEYLNSLKRIRDGKNSDPGSVEKIWIRDIYRHTGTAIYQSISWRKKATERDKSRQSNVFFSSMVKVIPMVRRGFMVRRGSVGSASACCKAGPSSILGSAPQGGYGERHLGKWRRINVLYNCDCMNVCML